jgi:hypothetical protein
MSNLFVKRKLLILLVAIGAILTFFVTTSIENSTKQLSTAIQGVSVPLGDGTGRVPQGEIFGINTVDQSFVASEDGLVQVKFTIATWARENTSTLNVKIMQQGESKPIFDSKVDTSALVDNNEYVAEFPAIKKSKGVTFNIVLSSLNGKSGNAVTVWLIEGRPYKEGTLLLAGT